MCSTYVHLPPAEELIEVIDANDQPFLLMPKAEVLTQGLAHRIVLVALRQQGGRILVTQRTQDTGSDSESAAVWGLSASTRVRAGEARMDAALRVLHHDIGVHDAQLLPGAGKAPRIPALKPFDRLHLSLFIAETPASNPLFAEPEKNAGVMFLDKDELQGMAQHFPEILSDGLLWAITSGALFNKAKE